MSALSLTNVSKSFGAIEIIRDVSLSIAPGERHAIIGPNGAGKSTLFNLISGGFAPTRGEIRLDGQRIDGASPQVISRRGLSRSFQVTNIFPRLGVFENIRCATLWPLGYRYVFWRALDGLRDARRRAEAILGLTDLEAQRDTPAGLLSYADQRALEIGLAIAGDAKVILLDEPTAGMSQAETTRAIALIRRISEGRGLIIVEHDMGVVFELAERISVLVYGSIIATGTPAEIRNNRQVQEAYLGVDAAQAAGAT